MGFGVANYRDFAKRQEIKNAASEIASDLRLAQSSATAGRKLTGCAGVLLGYDFLISGSTYTISAACPNTVQLKQVTLKTGLQMTNPSPNPIRFLPLGLGTNVPNSTTITVSHQTVTGNQQAIVVSQSGDIR